MKTTLLAASCARARNGAIRSLFIGSVLMHVIAEGVAAQETGTVSGFVADRLTLDRIADVLVRVRGTDLTAVTNVDGAFRIAGIPAGAQGLIFTHIAYGEHSEVVNVPGSGELRIDVRISRQLIEVSPLRVEALTELERRRISSGNKLNEIAREEIEEAYRRGLSLPELLRQGMSGVRVFGSRGSYCVEYRGTAMGGAQTRCREVAVFIDDVKVAAPSSLFATMPLQDIERLELLSPAEAGARYGIDAGWGVLLIETQQGPRPDRGRNVERPADFDWSLEPNPYPWMRVLGISVVGNAVGVGLGLLLADQCLQVDSGFNGLRASCVAPLTVITTFGSLVLPSAAGSVAARWAGSTNRSRGRIFPSAVLGATSVAFGYLLVVRGETHGSGGARVAGGAILVIGTPLIMTFADRVFRDAR
jgi:hypothetical protein